MRRLRKSFVAITVAGLLAPAAASAQGAGGNDPSAGTPSGTVYQIPLDTARKDAAPRGGRGTGDSSPLRSANNFGSSSQVPGVPPTGGGGGGASGGGAAAAGGVATGTGGASTGTTGSASASTGGTAGGSGGSNGTGGGKAAGGGGSAPAGGRAGGRSAARAPKTNAEALIPSSQPSGPSSTRTYLLIAIGIAVALALGAAGRLAARRR